MSPGSWVSEVNARGAAQLGNALGLTFRERPAPGSLSPCPTCGELRRGSGDRRGPVGLTRNGAGWRCHRCGASGSAVDLAALVVLGRKAEPGDREDWAKVRAACSERGLAEGPGCPSGARKPLPPAQPSTPPRRPPQGEVEALWRACRPVTSDAEVAGWLKGRCIDPGEVEARDLARAIPVAAELPSWARFRRQPWTALGYRAVLPLYDPAGRLVSLRARAVRAVEGPKAVAPSGAEVVGLVLADSPARLWLSCRPLGDGTSSAEQVARCGLVIAEGEPDWLTWATHWSDANETAPAVLGIVAGGWTAEIASKVPNGAEVTIATHHDPAGDKYAAAIVETFAGRTVRLSRWTPPKEALP
jgi:hypothetical protein